ncbi:hypothetical protein C5167_016722 [Papaver somniferum]|nr:hypothetical protein C5167_016722 [Papaver somniferum]
METRVQQQAALNTVPATIWKELWKMKLPHHIKLFIWKCLKGIVPTRLRLSQAMQDIETHCEICKQEEESMYHLLISCNHAKAVWRSLSINIDQIIANCQSIQQWIISWFQDVQNVGERTGLKGTYAAGIIDAEAGECMAILEGLKWAKEMELDNTHLVADAEVVSLRSVV